MKDVNNFPFVRYYIDPYEEYNFVGQNIYFSRFFYRKKANIILETLFSIPNIERKTIMDAGCWNGLFLLALSKRFRNVIGVEAVKTLYENCLRILREAKVNNVEVLNCRIEDLNFSNTVEVVLCHGVLQFVTNPYKVVKKLVDVCSEYILIGMPTWSLISRIYNKLRAKPPSPRKIAQVRAVYGKWTGIEYKPTSSEFIQLIRQFNIRIMKIAGVGKPHFISNGLAKLLEPMYSVVGNTFPFYLLDTQTMIFAKKENLV